MSIIIQKNLTVQGDKLRLFYKPLLISVFVKSTNSSLRRMPCLCNQNSEDFTQGGMAKGRKKFRPN